MQSIEEEIQKQKDFVEALSYQSEQLSDLCAEAEREYDKVRTKYNTERQHLKNLLNYQAKESNV